MANQYHEDSDIECNKMDEKYTDMTTAGDHLPERIIVRVRVLEAAGLCRSTNFTLKKVTINRPFCTLQLKNVKGKGTSTRLKKTRKAKKTLFPCWDQIFTFQIDHEDVISKEGFIRLNVKGARSRRNWNETELGKVDIPINEIVNKCLKSSNKCYQSWFPLMEAPQMAAGAGKLFLVFQEIKLKKSGPLPPPIENFDHRNTDLGIFIGTLNCGNALPPSNMEDWLKCDISKHKIVVVGLQESTEDNWEGAICKAINKTQTKTNQYVLLASHKLAEMQVFCYVDKRSLDNSAVCHVSMYNEATGIAGLYGNKGGTIISMDYGGTSLCFINSHLAAHQTKESHRNADFKEICYNINGVGNIKQTIMNQFHHVFWLGDLNYRCDYAQKEEREDTPTPALFNLYKEKIASGELDDMLEDDQLIPMLNDENPAAFFGFQEAKITFKPTFKVNKGEDYNYKSKRCPAWCDRILWKSAPGYKVHPNRYSNAPKICSSDHKPVYGEFTVETWKRQPGRIDNEGTSDNLKAKLMIDFKNCMATGLREADLGSKSDPYLHFPRQELLNQHYKSKIKYKTLNPVWSDTDMPYLELHRTNIKFLENALLLVQCRDYDRFKPDDRLGNGYLSIKPLLDVKEPGSWVPFKQVLTWQGTNHGVLEGEYRLRKA